jgi:hypothetical protein
MTGNEQRLDDRLALDLRNSRLGQRGEDGAQPVEALHVSGVGGQIGKPLRKVIFGVFVDAFDRVSLAEKAKQVNGMHFLVGEVRVGVIALSLTGGAEASV